MYRITRVYQGETESFKVKLGNGFTTINEALTEATEWLVKMAEVDRWSARITSDDGDESVRVLTLAVICSIPSYRRSKEKERGA